MPDRKGSQRRRQRVLDLLHTLPDDAQRTIRRSIEDEKGRAVGEAASRDTLVDSNAGQGDAPADLSAGGRD